MATTSFFSSTGPTNTETDAIESSVNAAAASQTAAATSETNAAASATSAASSASSATSSASSASSSSSSATTAKTAAETAKTASEAARDLANTYKDAAATSSATATTKANEASTSATNAANSATAAASSASAASTSASNAASSATSAASSAAGLTDEAIQDKVGAMFSGNTETGITITYQDGDGTIDAVVDTSSLTETLTNKTLTSPVLNTGVSGTAIKDEDNMSSNSATHLATQQSIKAYVDDVAQTTEEVQDIVGAMFSSNTETGITVTYEDSDGTIDLAVGTLNQDTTGTAALATEITVSANNSSDETVYPLFVDGATGSQGAESDTGLNYNPSSGILTATQFTGNLTGNVTGNVSGSSGSTTGNAATSTVATNVVVTDNESGNNNCAITFVNDLDGSTSIGLQSDGNLFYNPSTGTLTVENISVSGTQTIVDSVTMNASNQVVFEGSTANAHETFLTSIDATGDRTISLPDVSGTLPVLAAVSTTQITSTPEELNILDGVTSTTAELNILDGVTSTASELNLLDGSSANTVVNSKAVIYGSGGELAGTLSTAAQTNVTSLGTLSSLTVSGDVTVDTNTLKVDSSNNRVGVNQASPDVSIDAGSNTDAIHVPVGTTAQRPGSPAAGYFRYNSTTGDFEGYTGSGEWGAIAGSGGTAPIVNTMSGDGSDDTLTLTSAPVNENATVVTVDGVVQHKDTYSVSGTTLTFSEAPPNGSAVECITWVNTQITSALLLEDADSDTKVQVEESSDEDKIRFDTGGTERMVLDSGSLTVTPKIVSDAGIEIDNITIDGTEIDLSSGDLTIDVAGSITFDSDTGVIDFDDGGTNIGRIENASSDFKFESRVQDKDIVFVGNDGGTGVEAMRLDMSEKGRASFGADKVHIGSGHADAYLYGGAEGDEYGGSSNNSASWIRFSDNTSNNAIMHNCGHASGGHRWEVAGTEKMRIDSDGVGIGTNPAHPLHIVESADGPKIRLTRGGICEWDFSISNTSTLSGVGSGALELLPQNGNTANEFAIGQAGTTSALFHLTTSGATFSGSLSKGSGSFKIDHPLEAKKDTHHLVHSFIEGPQADLIYRGKVALSNGTATVNIDTEVGMTEGTFVALNTDVQCFTTNETDWDAVKGSLSGNILTITCQNSSSTATVSWIVIGERQDQHIKDTDWTDANGKVIVEPKKT